MCTIKYRSKPRYRGIDGVHIGVKLLYEHVGTPWGFLTKRSPSLRANSIEWRSVWEIRQNDLAFWMNRPVRKVLKEVIIYLFIIEPNRIRGKGDEKEPRRIRFSEGTNFLGAMTRRLNERERDKKERNIVTKETLRHRKEGKKRAMHEYVTCKTKKHHGKNPIQLNSTHKI